MFGLLQIRRCGRKAVATNIRSRSRGTNTLCHLIYWCPCVSGLFFAQVYGRNRGGNSSTSVHL